MRGIRPLLRRTLFFSHMSTAAITEISISESIIIYTHTYTRILLSKVAVWNRSLWKCMMHAALCVDTSRIAPYWCGIALCTAKHRPKLVWYAACCVHFPDMSSLREDGTFFPWAAKAELTCWCILQRVWARLINQLVTCACANRCCSRT